MDNFFNKIYLFKFRFKFLDDIYLRVIVRTFNIFLPLYYKLTNSNNKYAIKYNRKEKSESFVVSLTTFPLRIDKVWITIESILHQNIKPDKIILWLYEGEFNDKSSLPKNLLKLEKRGLQIRFCNENLMPHLKYFYSMKKYQDANIITIDDDIIYAPDLIEKLKIAHKKYPRAICSIISREIHVKGEKIYPSGQWKYLNVNTSPRYRNLVMGVGGTLYPKNSLHPEVFNLKNLKSMSLRADDLWLKVMSIKSNIKVLSLAGEYSRFFLPTIFENNISLMDSNIGMGENDIIFKNLLKYYKIPISLFEKKDVIKHS